MIITTNFTVEDRELIEENDKAGKVYFMILLKFFVPLSFLIGLLGLTKKGHGYWFTTIVALLFFLLITLYLFIKDSILYKKDLRTQLKFSGTITVLRKSKKRNDCIIYTDSKDIKRLDVLFFDVFEQIEIGDELHVEVAKFSKHILKLEKGILVLLNGV